MTSEEEADHCADSAFPYLHYRRQHADCQARFTAYRRALPVGRKPLPLGEVSPKVTERASPSQPDCYAAISRSHCRSDTIATLAFLRQHPCPLRRFAPRPGCGSQRLLRCRLHPAGRCPNSSSLFPPLAAVVAVAPRGGATGVPGNSALAAGISIWHKR